MSRAHGLAPLGDASRRHTSRPRGSLLRSLADRALLLDLFAGLGVTFKHLFRKKATIQYPEVRKEPPPRFRGMFRLDEERCIKCDLCAIDCPIDIIYIDWHWDRDEETGKKKKILDRFDIDVQRCMFCGLCEEGCPTEPKSIWMTTGAYELASYDRWGRLYMDMDALQDWQLRPRYTDEEVE